MNCQTVLNIDLGNAFFRACVFTPERMIISKPQQVRYNRGAYVIFINGAWKCDVLNTEMIKVPQQNCVYDIKELIRSLRDNLNENSLKRQFGWGFAIRRVCEDDIEFEVNENNKMTISCLSDIIKCIFMYYINRVSIEYGYTVKCVSLVIPYDTSKQEIALYKKAASKARIASLSFEDERIVGLTPYLYYGGINREYSNVLLIEYGDSSFTATIAKIQNGMIQLIGSVKKRKIAGRYLDRMLLKYISYKYYKLTKSNLFCDIQSEDQLLQDCERLKIELSSKEDAEIRFTLIGGKSDVMIRKRELELLLQLPLLVVEKTISTLLEDNLYNKDVIDHVITLGGNCRIPAVAALFRRMFPCSEMEYSTSIDSPYQCGLGIINAMRIPFTSRSQYCYRISINEEYSFFIGKSMRCLSKDIMLYPIPITTKNVALLRIVIERCKECDIRLVEHNPPKESMEKGYLEYVCSYFYTCHLRKNSDNAYNTISNNPFFPYSVNDNGVYVGDVLEVTGKFNDDCNIQITLIQVHNGCYYNDSKKVCLVQNNTVLEMKPNSNKLLSGVTAKDYSPLSKNGSIQASHAFMTLLTDRSKSPIFQYTPEKGSIFAELSKRSPVMIGCLNRHLRVHYQPIVQNMAISLAYPSSPLTVALASVSDTRTGVMTLMNTPRFLSEPAETEMNKKLFPLGEEAHCSPISVCHYSGAFVNNKKEGNGLEYSCNGSVIYQGQWKEDQYEGNGTCWLMNNCRWEGRFEGGVLNGKARLINDDGDILFEGMYANGKRNGKGEEYLNEFIYNGDYCNDKREGMGVLCYQNEIIYEGEWRNDMRNGKGREKKGDCVYEGSWKNDWKDGYGIVKNVDHDVVLYEGEWKENMKNGKGKEYSVEHQLVYEGEYRNGKYHHHGIEYKNGIICYEGDYKDGYREGYGKVYHDEGWLEKEGVFVKGKMNGNGCQFYDKNHLYYYRGDFMNDEKNGKGEEYMQNEELYEGEYYHNLFHGKGKLYNAQKVLVYNGYWCNGVKHGEGEFQDTNNLYSGSFERGKKTGYGKQINCLGEVYEGEFDDDQFCGEGVLYNSSGAIIYDGEWRNGRRNGKGRVYLGNGEYYEGEIIKDEMSGKGIIYYINGLPKYVGEFRKDMRNGEGIEYNEDGSVYDSGFYVNNEKLLING